MTEALATHLQPVGESKPGSVGVPLPNSECKVPSDDSRSFQ